MSFGTATQSSNMKLPPFPLVSLLCFVAVLVVKLPPTSCSGAIIDELAELRVTGVPDGDQLNV